MSQQAYYLILKYIKQSAFSSLNKSTEASLMELGAKGFQKGGKKYQNLENRLSNIKEKYEALDNTIHELLRTSSYIGFIVIGIN